MLPRIISLSGLQGSGKDTVADYLCNVYGYERISFASSLKDATAAIFSWDREMLEGRTPEARAKREEVDEWWEDRLQIPCLTPRVVLQQLGTEVFRNAFHYDIWIASLEHKMMTAPASARFVITDCRFENEICMLRKLNAAIFWIQRGPLPAWWGDAQKGKTPEGIHVSETGWIRYVVDSSETSSNCIENNGTLDDLYKKIKAYIAPSV